jgi:hypothetical protein
MIGGSDKVLWVDEVAPAAEIIVRAVRRHWPQYVFHNADDDHAMDPAQLSALPVPSGREFFLYRDMGAAQDWLQSGATDNNKNALVSVILGNRRKPALGQRSITLVGGDWTGELAALLADIQTAFDGFAKNPPADGNLSAPGPLPHAAERE